MGRVRSATGRWIVTRGAELSGWLVILEVVSFLLFTCPVRAAAQDRTWFRGGWRVAGGVPAESPELFNPIYLAATDSLLITYDLGDFAVKAFHLDGSLAWKFGRLGRGPGEFESVADMQMDHSGRIWLTDASNLRITILGSDGKMVRLVTLNNSVWSAIPARSDSFFAKLPLRTAFYDVFDPSGKMVAHLPMPKILLSLDHNQAVQNATANRRGILVSALRWASDFFIIDLGTRRVREHVGIDSIGPAKALTQKLKIDDQTVVGHRIDPRAEAVNESVGIDQDYLYLLVRGSTQAAQRIVDRHRISDGAYEGSYLLPSRTVQLARTRRGFAVLVTDPTPRIDLLEWTPR